MRTTLLLICLALAGCALFEKDKPKVTFRIHEEVDAVMSEGRTLPVTMPDYNLQLTVSPHPSLSERSIKSADLYPTAGGAGILVRFDRHGMIVLDEITTRLRGRRLVTFLNGRPVAVWLVNQRLTNGQFLIQGDFTDAEAQAAVDELNRVGKKKTD